LKASKPQTLALTDRLCCSLVLKIQLFKVCNLRQNISVSTKNWRTPSFKRNKTFSYLRLLLTILALKLKTNWLRKVWWKEKFCTRCTSPSQGWPLGRIRHLFCFKKCWSTAKPSWLHSNL